MDILQVRTIRNSCASFAMAATKYKLLSCVGYSLRVAKQLDVPQDVHVLLKAVLLSLRDDGKAERKLCPRSLGVPISICDALQGSEQLVTSRSSEALVDRASQRHSESTATSSESSHGRFDGSAMATHTDSSNMKDERADVTGQNTWGDCMVRGYGEARSVAPTADAPVSVQADDGQGLHRPDFDFRTDPTAYLEFFLSQASCDTEILQGLQYLQQHYRAVVKDQPPSEERSLIIRLLVEIAAELRRRRGVAHEGVP